MQIVDEIKNTDDGIDVSAALAEMSSDLFGETGTEEGKSEAAGAELSAGGSEAAPADVSGIAAVETPPAQAADAVEAVIADNAQAVQDTGAPKTWSKDALTEWAKIPARAQAEILKREEDIFKGIEEYKGAAAVGKAYESVVEPYRAALTAENVNPVDLFKAFAGNHWLLSRGTPNQKLEVVTNLIKGYGIDLEAVIQRVDAQPYVDPQLKQLEDRLARFEQQEQLAEQKAATDHAIKVNAEITAFSVDPANIYFEQVAGIIPGLLRGGAAANLAEAYQQAIYLNPVTRDLELARLQAERTKVADTERADKLAAARAATAADVRTVAKVGSGTAPVGTIDETMEQTLAAIRARA